MTPAATDHIALSEGDVAAHTRIVTRLLNSSRGDLMLDGQGNLRARITWGDDLTDLPWHQHRPGELLATIHPHGWRLTPEGATHILQNSDFLARDRARLHRIAKGGV